jgi:hypothetical protein
VRYLIGSVGVLGGIALAVAANVVAGVAVALVGLGLLLPLSWLASTNPETEHTWVDGIGSDGGGGSV